MEESMFFQHIFFVGELYVNDNRSKKTFFNFEESFSSSLIKKRAILPEKISLTTFCLLRLTDKFVNLQIKQK